MKNTILKFSDLSNVKVGDTIYTFWGEYKVVRLDNDAYPVVTDGGTFTFEGKSVHSNKHPSAFTENVFEMELKPKEYWAMVSDEPITDENKGDKRRVFMEKNGMFLAWGVAETDEEAEEKVGVALWKYATPITEEEEPLTLEQRVERLEKINNLK